MDAALARMAGMARTAANFMVDRLSVRKVVVGVGWRDCVCSCKIHDCERLKATYILSDG